MSHISNVNVATTVVAYKLLVLLRLAHIIILSKVQRSIHNFDLFSDGKLQTAFSLSGDTES